MVGCEGFGDGEADSSACSRDEDGFGLEGWHWGIIFGGGICLDSCWGVDDIRYIGLPWHSSLGLKHR